MGSRMQTPHDRLFKRVFSNPEEAAGELRHVLPPAVIRLIDWSTLRAVRATFIDDHLAETRSDLLFSVMLGGRPAFVYVLLEHQSTSDALMAFRLLAYMVRIWEAYLREHPKSDRLPVIVPVVVHHSEGGWTAPLVFSELLELDDEALTLLTEYVPSFTYRLDEISAASDAELVARRMTAFGIAALICLGRARTSEDVISVLERLPELLRNVLSAPNGVGALATILRYVSEVTKSPPERVQQLVQRLGPRGEEAYMTAADILRQEGETQGEAKVLLKLLQVKFGELPEAVVQRVRDARIEELDRWVERVLSATSIDEALPD
jgi:predicted transposase/invertase (TIGR01784 family)